MDDDRPVLATALNVSFDASVRRVGIAPPLERNRQKARGFVHDQQAVVLVHDAQVVKVNRPLSSPGAAGPVHPQPNDIAACQTYSAIDNSRFLVVDEYLTAFEGHRRAPPRSEPALGSQILVQAHAVIFAVDRPVLFRGHQAYC
jgi:hypothetical protein